MKFFIFGVFVCLLVENSKGETTEHFKKVLRPFIEDCRDKLSFTNEDMETVLNIGPHYSPAAQCLVECSISKMGMMRKGRLVPPEEFIVPYKRLFADEPERLKDPLGVVTACYEQEMNNPHTDSCEVAFGAVVCTARETYGDGTEPTAKKPETQI